MPQGSTNLSASEQKPEPIPWPTEERYSLGPEMSLRSASYALLLGLGLSLGACTPPPTIRPPDPASLRPLGELSEFGNTLIYALFYRRAATIRSWMAPALRAQVTARDLLDAGSRIAKTHGLPQALVESKIHREGELVWYSELVLHRLAVERADGGPIRLMLYQFAVDPQGRLVRLLVREHVHVRDLHPPAERYLAINRFHFPSVGEWTIIHGGRRKSTNYHHNSRTQRYAYDIVIKKGGRARSAKGKRKSFSYGRPLTAPASGVVITAINNVPENRRGEKGKGGGNGVVIDHGFGEFTSLWHMIPGTVQVAVGDQVVVGQHLGNVGNSGHSSGPHIHFHASTDPRNKSRAMGLPAPFVDVYIDGVWIEKALPVRGQRIRRPEIKAERHPPKLSTAPTIYFDL